jgi:hypothetical protein
MPWLWTCVWPCRTRSSKRYWHKASRRRRSPTRRRKRRQTRKTRQHWKRDARRWCVAWHGGVDWKQIGQDCKWNAPLPHATETADVAAVQAARRHWYTAGGMRNLRRNHRKCTGGASRSVCHDAVCCTWRRCAVWTSSRGACNKLQDVANISQTPLGRGRAPSVVNFLLEYCHVIILP